MRHNSSSEVGGRSKLREMLETGGIDEEEEGEEATRKTKKKSEGFIEGRIDCVAMLDEATFISGGDSGCVISISSSLSTVQR